MGLVLAVAAAAAGCAVGGHGGPSARDGESDVAPLPNAPDAGADPAGPVESVELVLAAPTVRVVAGRRDAVTVRLVGPLPPGGLHVEATAFPDSVIVGAASVGADATEATLALEVGAGASQGVHAVTLAAARHPSGRPLATAELSLVIAGDPGSLDATFDHDGRTSPRVTWHDADWVRASCMSSDGELVVAGAGQSGSAWDAFVARLDARGGLVGDHGEGGAIIGVSGLAPSGALDVACTPDGGALLLAFGHTTSGAGTRQLLRFDASGAPVATFGRDGVAPVLAGRHLVARPGGFLVVDYHRVDAFLPSGLSDRRFGVSAVADRFDLTIAAAATDAAGRVVLAGLGEEALPLTRLGPDGWVDETFGEGGTVRVSMPRGVSEHALTTLASLADGTVLAAGHAPEAGRDRSAGMLVRIGADGTPDLAFGQHGVASWGPPGLDCTIEGVAGLADGRLLLAGSLRSAKGGPAPFVARLHADASPDPSFGDGGVALLPGGGGARDLHVDAALGRVTIVGESPEEPGWFAARLWL